jgi:predicted ArsR family transcriptional regulator
MAEEADGMAQDTRRRGRTGELLAPGLSPSQQRILERVKRVGSTTIPVLAEVVGLNIETVRHHLRALESLGYVERRGTRRTGPGRPEVVYGLTERSEQLFPRREGEVLRALAAHLKETGNEALLEEFFATFIGARRGEALARVEGLRGEARLREVARILTELGFMASAEPGSDRARLDLCHCPVRELVAVSTVPCRAEIGFIRELVGEQLTRLAYIPAGDASCSYRTRTG